MATRLSAQDRREQILQAAARAFSRGGMAGTSTDDVAREAGVSQPYVVQKFGTKIDLFEEVFDRATAAVLARFAVELNDPEKAESAQVWDNLGAAYSELVADRDVLMVLSQGFCAGAAYPQISRSAREFMSTLFTTLITRTGCTPQHAREFIANGMLLNALLSMDAMGHVNDDPGLASLAECARECDFGGSAI
ncbi:TetR/AcrR family transcriptional regulator [Nocardia sp. NPDC058666]|uniref:TetR/AcrR family transcriptional regulator n=1 Tax=unclassified Nocardia TaxID=2637762 RepID=UPI00365387D3